ncbi:hypothetical protein WG66_000549 [Moniliophthora roreri]|nr:hypothetical protein WG66_000549 [Moniliophthora roreri]
MTQLGPSDTPFLLTTTSHDARFKDNPGTELEPILQKLSSSYFAISYGNKRTSAFRKGNEDVLQNKTNLIFISSHLGVLHRPIIPHLASSRRYTLMPETSENLNYTAPFFTSCLLARRFDTDIPEL